MFRVILGLVFLMVVSPSGYAQTSADGAFLAPVTSEEELEASLHPIPQAQVAYYVSQVGVVHTFREFEGQNEALRSAKSNSPALKVADGYPVSLSSADLFAPPLADGLYQVYLAGVSSVDACSLRLLLDVSALTKEQEAWVIDPTSPRAFGPYQAAEGAPRERWLATVDGDTAVLMVRCSKPGLPEVALKGISHFFWKLDDLKELPCNINIACETDSLVEQISTAIGLVLVSNGLETLSASGALMNVPATPEFEPYLLTANHAVPDRDAAFNTDVVWDYRATTCGATDARSISLLPRSQGVDLLATSATLDATLVRLDRVPVGGYGRAYLGWDTREPKLGEPVIVIHHPQARHMRITYGRVQAIDQIVSTYHHETRVGWDQGVTEPGSSGACLLYDDGTLRTAGTLSGGSNQTCTGGPGENWDYFSSFRFFYREISPAYLTGPSGHSSYTEPQSGEGEGEGEPSCPGTFPAITRESGPFGGAGADLVVMSVAGLLLGLAGMRRMRRHPAPIVHGGYRKN